MPEAEQQMWDLGQGADPIRTTLLARSDSKCGWCQEMILADLHEIECVDDEWLHAQCAEEAR